eukprot:CAMPEP_0170551710 /NCGR_PEP_ID=MMETSP0211-20121228/9713_1 /TAXON_ID=311385 /ORGANISM="Pseudokeronopsis sp., Strain OXSARD2" /LENGTH=65 /DNA_ID=CAMNT_0010859051 /DNA_START=954 /DNA_END=1151 /DNA_ORIENTATION=-
MLMSRESSYGFPASQTRATSNQAKAWKVQSLCVNEASYIDDASTINYHKKIMEKAKERYRGNDSD